MAIKIDQTCSRCRRVESVTLDSVADAAKVDDLQKRRQARLKELKEYIAAIPKEELPDFFAISEGVVAHEHLCDNADLKRSCTKRVQELITMIDTLDERKPRSKKKADTDVTK